MGLNERMIINETTGFHINLVKMWLNKYGISLPTYTRQVAWSTLHHEQAPSNHLTSQNQQPAFSKKKFCQGSAFFSYLIVNHSIFIIHSGAYQAF